MHIKNKIGSRGLLVTFDELTNTPYNTTTNIYIINTSKSIVVCDTYLGPDALMPIMTEIDKDKNKKTIIINSHNHWDHIWGNCYFENSDIIAHKTCLEEIYQYGIKDLERFSDYKMGNVKIVPPNIVFDNEIEFSDLGIKIFYSPGHSQDSISVYDAIDKVLFAADNVEKPIPSYIDNKNILTQIHSLEHYSQLDLNVIIPGHGDILTKDDLRLNIKYLQDLNDGKIEQYFEDSFKKNHLTNIFRIQQ